MVLMIGSKALMAVVGVYLTVPQRREAIALLSIGDFLIFESRYCDTFDLWHSRTTHRSSP